MQEPESTRPGEPFRPFVAVNRRVGPGSPRAHTPEAERLGGGGAIATLDDRDFGAVTLAGEPRLWPRDLSGGGVGRMCQGPPRLPREQGLMRKIAAAAMVLLASACVNVSHSVLLDRSAYPVPLMEVDIFLPDDDIPGDCERVALLFASGNQHFTDEGDLLNSLREEAGELGANAIDIQFMSEAGTVEVIAAAVLDAPVERDADGIALYCPGGTSPGR